MNKNREPEEGELQILFNYYQKGNYSKAELLATEITKKFPHNQLSWKILASIFKQTGRLSESLNAGKKAVNLNIQDPDAHNNLGNTFLTMEKFKDSEFHFKKAIAIKPDFIDSYAGLGLALYKIKKFKESELIFKKALELKPNLIGCNNNLAVTLLELDKLEEAKKFLEIELSINPNYIESHYNLGVVMQKLSRHREAELSYIKSIKLNPKYFKAYNNLGNLFQDLNRLDEAEENYKIALDINSNYAEAYFNLSNVLLQLDRFEEAEVNCKLALNSNPNFIEAYYILGNILQKLNNIEEAEINYKKAIELQPNFSKPYNKLGIMLQRLERFEEAEECYKKYISIKPDGNTEIISKGNILFNKGEYKQAISYFDNYNTKESRASALYSLYALGNIDTIHNRLKLESKSDDKNLSIAAFSSFISQQQKMDIKNTFCKNPLDFIYYSNIENHTKYSERFITNIISTLPKIKSSWNPPNTSVSNGFQTVGNIFTTTHKSILDLKLMILSEIDSYYMSFKNESCAFIENWPIQKNLEGWHIILKEQGFNTPHMHPSGWLSGVIYLEVVPSLEKNEGAIEFSLNGEYYFHDESPKITYQPKVGDIIFFPSSLNHKTIPFSTNKNRVIISFDLLPDRVNN